MALRLFQPNFNVKLNALEIFRVVSAILVNANRKRNYHLTAYRIFQAIDELRAEFGEAKDLDTIKKVAAYVLDAPSLPAVIAATLYEPPPEHLRESVQDPADDPRYCGELPTQRDRVCDG